MSIYTFDGIYIQRAVFNTLARYGVSIWSICYLLSTFPALSNLVSFPPGFLTNLLCVLCSHCPLIFRTHITRTHALFFLFVFSLSLCPFLSPSHSSSQSIGVFPPNSERTISVTLLPLALGVHKISGFRLFTEPTENVRISVDFDNIHEMLVLKRADSAAGEDLCAACWFLIGRIYAWLTSHAASGYELLTAIVVTTTMGDGGWLAYLSNLTKSRQLHSFRALLWPSWLNCCWRHSLHFSNDHFFGAILHVNPDGMNLFWLREHHTGLLFHDIVWY